MHCVLQISSLGLSDVLTLFLITDVSDQGTEQPRKLTYFSSARTNEARDFMSRLGQQRPNRKKLEKRHGMVRGQQMKWDIVENELPIKLFGGKENENIVLLGYG